jgi:hypothetical protein
VKTVVVSDDNVVYVATIVAKALGPLLEQMVSGMKPGASMRGQIVSGLRDSLGEQLADTSSKSGFWISFSQGVQISSPGIRHPLSEDETAVKEALGKQVRLGSIRVVPLDEDKMLVLPESPLTPVLEELRKLEVGREIETGKIFTMITPPAPEAVDRILDVIVQRGGNALGFIVLPHQNKEGRTSNFVGNVEEGVKALGNRELTALGHFSTITDLAPDFHFPFFAGGTED